MCVYAEMSVCKAVTCNQSNQISETPVETSAAVQAFECETRGGFLLTANMYAPTEYKRYIFSLGCFYAILA